MNITLRERAIKNGNKSLFLDIYLEGKRKQIPLKLYLVPEVNETARLANKNAMKRANEIKSDYVLHPEKISFQKKG